MISQKEKDEALEAGRIVSSPVFQKAVDTLDEKYVREWRSGTNEEREAAWYKQNALKNLVKEIVAIIECAALRDHGKDAQITAAMNAAKRKRVKNG